MADDEVIQLDLTLSVSEVPQANSLPLFISLLDAVHRGQTTTAQLAETLDIEERTVQYYVDFGRWLKMLKVPEPGHVAFTETGQTFVESVPARGRLFAQAMFARKLIKTVQALKRDSTNADDVETLDTKTACYKAIIGLTDLSETTAERRASGLAAMLEAAYKPSAVDWSTGQEHRETSSPVEFEGRSFLTALAARQFGAAREHRIGFPMQVWAFVENKGHGLSAKVWRRASWSSADGKALWFGSVPVNRTTIALAERGGRDLRGLLLTCVPYVALAVGILSYRDPAGRPSVRLTHDMYGLRFWEHDREVGEPIEVMERLAVRLGLVPVKGVPAELAREGAAFADSGTAADLIEILLATGFIKGSDTTFEIATGVTSELRTPGPTGASGAELLSAIHDEFRAMLAAGAS